MLTSVVMALSGVFAAVSCDDVIVLTDADFSARLASFDFALVKYFAPWCGQCKKIAPEFEKAATVLKDNDPPIFLIEVDCTGDGKEACSQHGVRSYPTLKVFKKGIFAFDYNGPREADGIVEYMKGKAELRSTFLPSIVEVVAYMAEPENCIIGFFTTADSEVRRQFEKLSDLLGEKYRFGHSYNRNVRVKYGYDDEIVIFRADQFHSKFEPTQLKFTGDVTDLQALQEWITHNIHGLVGHRTSTNRDQFPSPLVVVYYDVDYTKNTKGTNYWRNRVLKVAKQFSDAGRKVTFAISNAKQFSRELTSHGLTYSGEKAQPLVGAVDENDKKYSMTSDFSAENLENFVSEFLDDKLKPYLKSEPIPEHNDDPVKVVVAETFDEIVNDATKDVLVEFYAPWCGHCKSLAPKYEELAKKMKGEEDIIIAKMDATANDIPKQYNVRGFPTIYFAAKGSKQRPKKYEGGREVGDFVKYLAKHATTPLKSYTREGHKTKVKPEKEL